MADHPAALFTTATSGGRGAALYAADAATAADAAVIARHGGAASEADRTGDGSALDFLRAQSYLELAGQTAGKPA